VAERVRTSGASFYEEFFFAANVIEGYLRELVVALAIFSGKWGS
jgi:hypothetical protein